MHLGDRRLPLRFWLKVDLGDNDYVDGDCWLWVGSRTPKGYGKWWTGGGRGVGKFRYVHRATFELEAGPVPAGLVLDHLCRARGCCNPAHLEAVTQKVNLQRGHNIGRPRRAA